MPTTQPGSGTTMMETNPPQFLPFFQAIGRAITTWQHVESALCAVFVNVSTCQKTDVATAIFYSFRDFSDKLNLVNSAARLSLSATRGLNDWESIKKQAGLRKRLKDAVEYRNALAHFHLVAQIPGGTPGPSVHLAILGISDEGVVVKGDPSDVPVHPPGVHLLLRPNSADPNQQFNLNPSATKRPMKIQDVIRIQRLFNSIIQDLNALAEKSHQPLVPGNG